MKAQKRSKKVRKTPRLVLGIGFDYCFYHLYAQVSCWRCSYLLLSLCGFRIRGFLKQIGRYFVVLMATINLVNIATKAIIAFCKNLAKDIDKRNKEKNNEKNEEKRKEIEDV